MHDRPQARTEGIISEFVGDDLVIYDEVTQTAHSLSSAATLVWELCTGDRFQHEIALELGFEPAVVARAVAELGESGLLDDSPLASPSIGISRRDAAKRLAKVGGAAFVAPLIYSVAIGPAAAFASGLPDGTTQTATQCPAAVHGTAADTNCTSGRCYSESGAVLYCAPAGCVGMSAACVTDADCCATVVKGAGVCKSSTCKN
jgi:hypothetical protein